MNTKDHQQCPSVPARRTWLNALLATTCVALTTVTPVAAQQAQTQDEIRAQFLEDTGAANRIDAAGKLRMLSQRVPAAACNYAAGIATDASGALLTAASDEFQTILKALEFGDEALGIIGAEERRKTQIGLRKLNELWEPMFDVSHRIRDGGGTAEEIREIADESGPVLDIAKLLVSEISGQYSNPAAILQIDALTIDIAGRQRMLSQRISKNVCLVASGVNVETAMTELAGATQSFETALDALIMGRADAGIRPPPTPQISADLAVVTDDWEVIKPIVLQVLAGETIDDEARGIVFEGANQLMADMNTVVGHYTEASKQDI